MNVLLILIPVSVILGGLGLCAFLWTVRSGQYDDVDGVSARVLLDDDLPLSKDVEDGSGAQLDPPKPN